MEYQKFKIDVLIDLEMNRRFELRSPLVCPQHIQPKNLATNLQTNADWSAQVDRPAARNRHCAIVSALATSVECKGGGEYSSPNAICDATKARRICA